MSDPDAGYIGDAVKFTGLHHADADAELPWGGSRLCQATQREQVEKTEQDNVSHDLTNVQVFYTTPFVVLYLHGFTQMDAELDRPLCRDGIKIVYILSKPASIRCVGVSRPTNPVLAGFS